MKDLLEGNKWVIYMVYWKTIYHEFFTKEIQY